MSDQDAKSFSARKQVTTDNSKINADLIAENERLQARVSELEEHLRRANNEASDLVWSIWRRHYSGDMPNFELLDSVAGIISQINNMVAGLLEENDLLRYNRNLEAVRQSVNISESWRPAIKEAINMAYVFDDGGDGADAESASGARGVVSLLNKLLAKTDEQDQGHE